MRWYILRTLLYKEWLRHRANRGGLVLAALLVAGALLLSFFGRDQGTTVGLTAGAQRCYIDYEVSDDWIAHLSNHRPPELAGRLLFRPLASAPLRDGTVFYEPNVGAIQVRNLEPDGTGPRRKVWIWYPGSDASALAPYEAWFWRESQRYYAERTSNALGAAGRYQFGMPDLVTERSQLAGGVDARSTVAASLVLFALFFVCVYLLPSLTCEERERGVLLAQALTPASPREILAAKFLFYPAAGLGLAAVLAGVTNPAALTKPMLWLTLVVLAVGSLGIGLSIASVAKTQRAASMGALCYMMVVAMVLFLCQIGNIPVLPYLALEFHGPRMLHAALAGRWEWYHWGNLAAAAGISMVWACVAGNLFRKYGWQ